MYCGVAEWNVCQSTTDPSGPLLTQHFIFLHTRRLVFVPLYCCSVRIWTPLSSFLNNISKKHCHLIGAYKCYVSLKQFHCRNRTSIYSVFALIPYTPVITFSSIHLNSDLLRCTWFHSDQILDKALRTGSVPDSGQCYYIIILITWRGNKETTLYVLCSTAWRGQSRNLN